MKKEIKERFNKYLTEYVKKDKVNHAYLIESNYQNRLSLAEELAKKILSFDSDISVLDLENLNDLNVVNPSDSTIKTEDIENLKEEFKTKSLVSSKRIYIINDADRMNEAAANKLLKFLEEPEDDIVAILTTDNKNKLLDTILSRCILLNFFVYENKFEKYDQDYIDELLDFVLNIEENKEKAIAFQNRYDIKKLSDRKYVQDFLNNLLYIYDDALKDKYGKKIEYFVNDIDKIKKISENNTILMIKNKIASINNCIDRLKYNPNIKLLIDKLIITMSGVDLNA